jgi:hypothetical protein
VEKRFLIKLDELRQARMQCLENKSKKNGTTNKFILEADSSVTLNKLREGRIRQKKVKGNHKILVPIFAAYE